METTYEHWGEVRARLRSGVFSLTDELALIERGGDSSAETSYLSSKYGASTVATPPLIETMARVCAPAATQVFASTPMWAAAMARRDVDMIAVGPTLTPHNGRNLVIVKGSARHVWIYPERTLLMVDVNPCSRIQAVFDRARCRRIVYVGRKLTKADIGDQWYLDNVYPAHGHHGQHQIGSELRVYERIMP